MTSLVLKGTKIRKDKVNLKIKERKMLIKLAHHYDSMNASNQLAQGLAQCEQENTKYKDL